MEKPKVSVCVPIYNGEKYIEKCITSLFLQTLDSIEYIFVNDCTPDSSMKIVNDLIEKFPQRKPYVKIINHEFNQGIAISNRDGLMASSGEYVITCDNDDWLELDMYERLYNLAKDKNADVVCCDYFKEYSNGNTEKAVSHFEGTKDERIRAWITYSYKAYSWVTLVRGEIYRNQIAYAAIGYAEDCVRACQVQLIADKYEYIAEPLYHYRLGGLSSKRNFELIKENLKDFEWIFNYLKRTNKYIDEINFAILYKKINLSLSYKYDVFYKYWPEVNKLSIILKTSLPIKYKLMSFIFLMKLQNIFHPLLYLYRRFK